MTEWTVDHAAGVLLAAEQERTDRGPITDEWPGLDLATAYQVQRRLIDRKIAAGETIAGVKLGLTSRAKQRRMGIDSPLTAWLTDRMAVRPGEFLDLSTLIHPRVEPEIVFVLGQRLSGPGVTAARAMAAVSEVRAGLEIIDSRFADFRFTLPDVVADNASSARFVVSSEAHRPDGLALDLEACDLEIDGQVADSATGAAVQGHPAEALALAANSLGERGIDLEPGWIVLTGGLTDAVTLKPGMRIVARFTHLGSVVLQVSEG
ncbi:2-keto-4-pentenoate hydratase [Amycolatopsis pigmentata]|uniref:2-keto-4-pentenoate hydratase n=1 Tax=Amycolatopsis pigmentata TaxID=450801 RepID=A0ABW5FMH1_9PSEU